MKVTMALLLVAAVAVNAQIQICDPKLKPGQVPSSSVKMLGSTNSGDYSDLKLQWSRPNDGVNGGVPSCIESYTVKIVRARDNMVLSQSSVSVSPAHLTAENTWKGLGAGDTYKFTVQPKGPSQEGPSNGPIGSFTTAKKPPKATAVPL
jgi:hypothetical protein